jgi:hypothetical protein
MSKFSAAERESIMAQARKTVARHESERAQPPKPRLKETEWRLPQPEPEPEYVPGLDTRPAAAPAVDWDALNAVIDRRIESAITRMRGDLLSACEVIADEVTASRQAVADDLADAIRALKLELAEAQATITELRAASRAKTIDDPPAPPPLVRRTDLN